VHSLKQLSPIASTDAGIQIDLSEQHSSNADFPSVEIREPDSNVKFESIAQSKKQDAEIVSTDEGTQIDRNDEYVSVAANAHSPRIET
jgi:hypothetical protein